MARYSSIRYVERGFGKYFMQQFFPESVAPFSGIYHCVNCGDEIVAEKGHKLPAESHHRHDGIGPIVWRLVVEARTIPRSLVEAGSSDPTKGKLRAVSQNRTPDSR